MEYRKDIRLKNYDYKTNGYYFVTICTAMRRSWLEQYKTEVEKLLKDMPKRFSGVTIDFYSIASNHLHVIFVLNNAKARLGDIVRTFKALVTKSTGCKPFWEWNYYEHIIRDEKALYNIRKYIQENPLKETIDWEHIYSGINATATKHSSGAIYRTNQGGAIYRTLEGAKGVALIIVIFAMMLFAVLGWTLANLQSGDFEINLRGLDSERALGLAEAGAQWALNQLSQDTCWRTRSGAGGAFCGSVDSDCNDNGDWLSLPHNLGSGQYNICCRNPVSGSESGDAVIEARGYIPTQNNPRARREVKIEAALGNFNKALQAKDLFEWSAMHSDSRINGDIRALNYNGDGDANYNEPNIDYQEGSSPLPPDGTGDERAIASEPYPTIDMAYYETAAKDASYPPAGDNIWVPPRSAKITDVSTVDGGTRTQIDLDSAIFTGTSNWNAQALRNITLGAWQNGRWQEINAVIDSDTVKLEGLVSWSAGNRVTVVPQISSLSVDIPTRTYTLTFDCSLSWTIDEAVRNFDMVSADYAVSWDYTKWGVIRSIAAGAASTTLTVRVDDSVDLTNPANLWEVNDWLGEAKRYRDTVANQYLWYIMADALFDLRNRQSWEPGGINGNIRFRRTSLVAEGDIAIKGPNQIRFSERPFSYPNLATQNGDLASPDTPDGGSETAKRGQRDFNDMLYTQNGNLFFNYLDAKAAYGNNVTFDGQVRLNYDNDLTQLTGFTWGLPDIQWQEQ